MKYGSHLQTILPSTLVDGNGHLRLGWRTDSATPAKARMDSANLGRSRRTDTGAHFGYRNRQVGAGTSGHGTDCYRSGRFPEGLGRPLDFPEIAVYGCRRGESGHFPACPRNSALCVRARERRRMVPSGPRRKTGMARYFAGATERGEKDLRLTTVVKLANTFRIPRTSYSSERINWPS